MMSSCPRIWKRHLDSGGAWCGSVSVHAQGECFVFFTNVSSQFFFCLQVTASAIYATALTYTQNRRFEEWFIFLDVFDTVFHLAFL